MKLISTEFAQVTWIVNLSVTQGGLYVPEAIAMLNSRYRFVKSPAVEDLLNQRPNAVFEHGKFGDSVIRKFSLHSDGMISESQAGTEAAEQFLEDFVSWSKDAFGVVELDINESYKMYDSNLVAQMQIDLPEKMGFLRFICDNIETTLKQYREGIPEYQAAGFSLSSDSAGIAGVAPAPFQIERRVGQPFSNNLYFSSAPLRTRDHAKLLEMIESAI